MELPETITKRLMEMVHSFRMLILRTGLRNRDHISKFPGLYKLAKRIYRRMFKEKSQTEEKTDWWYKTFYYKTKISPARMEAASRAKSQTAYLGNGIVLCRILGKYFMYVDATDPAITPRLCLDGYWESWITLAVSRVLQPGWYCIDAGANFGYYSVLMADAIGPSGRLLAIEPVPRVASLLERTIKANGLENRATVLEKVISDTNHRKIKMVIPECRLSSATYCRTPSPSDEVIEAETVSLDEIIRDWPRVDLIKVDIEGAEEAMWHGMRQTVRKNRRLIIVMEFNAVRYADPKAFLEDILQEGFTLRYIDSDSEIKSLTVEQCLSERPAEDWMLFLQRR